MMGLGAAWASAPARCGRRFRVANAVSTTARNAFEPHHVKNSGVDGQRSSRDPALTPRETCRLQYAILLAEPLEKNHKR